MQDEAAVLEPQTDADASPEPDRYADDKSVDTAPEVLTEVVEVETEPTEVETEPESEVDSSPAEVEVLEEKADADVPDSVQERINEAMGKWRESERIGAAKDLEIERLREQVAQAPVIEEPFKTPADFDYDNDKYNVYMSEEVSRRATIAAREAVSAAQDTRTTEVIKEKFAEREAEFAKSVKDYDDVAYNPSLKVNAPMVDVIKAQELGPEMIYYLGSNPTQAAKIADLPEAAAGFELGLIQSSLTAAKVAAAAKPVTKAPPPPPKIKAGDAGIEKDVADMSDREFAKWREKQIAAR